MASIVLPADSTATYNAASIVLFGNLQLGSAFGDRRGITIDVDMGRFVEYRQSYFQVTERFDIVNHGVKKSTSVAGAIVGLHGKT